MADQSNSTSSSDDSVYFSYTQRQIFAAVGVAISVLGLCGNALVITAVAVSRKLRHTTNMFVLNLSIADLVTCVFIVPLQAVAALNQDRWPLPMILCESAAFALLVCLGCSVNNLASIAFNRYFMVIQSKARYLKMYSRPRTLLAILLTWLVPLLIAVITVGTGYIKLGFEPKFSTCTWIVSESSPNFVFILFAAYIPVQFALIFFNYARIFHHIRYHARRVQQMNSPEIPNQNALQKQNKLQNEVTKNLFCVVCFFILCILPYYLGLVLAHTGRFLPFAGTILLANSCVNPIIYAAKHPNFREVFGRIIRGKFTEIPERVSCRLFK